MTALTPWWEYERPQRTLEELQRERIERLTELVERLRRQRDVAEGKLALYEERYERRVDYLCALVGGRA